MLSLGSIFTSPNENSFNMLKASKVLVILGVLLLVISGILINQENNPNRLSFKITKSLASKDQIQSSARPVRIAIPSEKINLPIVFSKIQKTKWDTSDTGVSYLSDSPLPGEKGNSILYGHNYQHLLKNLPKVRPGQKIEITYSDKTKKTFIVQYTSVVSPSQIDVLSSTSDIRITLYTCTGFFDKDRFVVTALLSS